MEGRAVRGKIVWTMVLGNLFGAVLTWFYFPFVDYASAAVIADHAWGLDVLYFVAGFALLSGAGTVWGLRWSRPLQEYRMGARAVDPEIVRRRAILVPFVYTAITLWGWVLAGIIWGVLQP